MGKSTIGVMMETMGVPVHDSDAAVAYLLTRDSQARPAIACAFPHFEYPEIYEKKTYDLKRKELGDLVFNNDAHMQALESILHPLVRENQNEFIRAQKSKGRDIVCLDIPLLFETGAEQNVDYTMAVSAPDFIQRERVLARPKMSEEKFMAILERQMPDAEKCARSDYVIKTGLGRAHAMKALKIAMLDIRKKSGLLSEDDDNVNQNADHHLPE